jgi:glucokinase
MRGQTMTTVNGSDYFVGFDLGGTKMFAAVVDAGFQILARKRKKTKGHEGARVGLARIAETIQQALDEANVRRDQLKGIGIGCPGPLDLDRGIIIDAPNLGWANVEVAAGLGLDCPVVIANDVDVGVYGEYRFGAGHGARCVVGVFPGTGIGGGCVYEGRILRGKTSSCMEIGHVQVAPDGPVCGCGRPGCLEAVASRLAVSAAAGQAVLRGQAPHLLKLAGADLAEIRSGVLAQAIKAGDKVVEQIVRTAARHIGVALAGVVHLLAPDVVVLGGGMVEAMPHVYLDEVRRAADQRVMDSFRGTFEVVAAALGDEAAVLGAAAWASEVVARRQRPEAADS